MQPATVNFKFSSILALSMHAKGVTHRCLFNESLICGWQLTIACYGSLNFSLHVHLSVVRKYSASHKTVFFTSKFIIIIITSFSCRRQGASADKLHVKAAKFLPRVGLSRSKQDPINPGHGAQYLYHPPQIHKIYEYMNALG